MKKVFILFITVFLGYSVSSYAQQYVDTPKSVTDTTTTSLLIPNAFTPNNDGENDVFKIKNFQNQRLVEFKIFNRWGTILFQTTNPHRGWDGTSRGKRQPMGVYGYVIRIAYPGNVIETYKGTVTLIR